MTAPEDWPFENLDRDPLTGGEPERVGDILDRLFAPYGYLIDGPGVPGRPTGPDAEAEHDALIERWGGCGVDHCVICHDQGR